MAIKKIEDQSIHSIQSGQVITSISSVLKELVENALDAEATTINITLRNSGLDAIEVADNGHGIRKQDFASIARKHHTSKLAEFNDIDALLTYGFRGEALSSLTALAQLSVVTARDETVPMGHRITFDQAGEVENCELVASQRGTKVLVNNIFHNLPVRRKELERNLRREYVKLLSMIQQYACICVGVRIILSNISPAGKRTAGKKTVVFATLGSLSTRDNVSSVYGYKVVRSLTDLDLELPLPAVPGTIQDESAAPPRIVGHISRPVFGSGRATSDRQLFYINSRPCNLPQVAKAINDVYKAYNTAQSPFVLADLRLNTASYDLNVSPDKRTVLVHNVDAVVDAIRAALDTLFEGVEITVPLIQTAPAEDLAVDEPMGDNTSLGLEPSLISVPLSIERLADISPESAHSSPFLSARSISDHESQPRPSSPLSLFVQPGEDDDSSHQPRTTRDPDDGTTRIRPGRHARSGRAAEPENEEYEEDNISADERDRASDEPPTANDRELLSSLSATRPGKKNLTKSSASNHPQGGKTLKDLWGLDTSKQSDTRAATESHSESDEDKIISGMPQIRSRERKDADSSPKSTLSQAADSIGYPHDSVMDEVGSSSESVGGADITVNVDGLTVVASLSSLRTRERKASLDESSPRKKVRFSSPAKVRDNGNHDEENEDEEPSGDNTASKNSRRSRATPVEMPMAPPPTRHKDGTVACNIPAVAPASATLADRLDTLIEQMGLSSLSQPQPVPSGLDEEVAEAERKLALIVQRDDFLRMRVIGQFNLGFIIVVRPARQAPTPAGPTSESTSADHQDHLFIIDQHAADEKATFEHLCSTFRLSTQRLVRPLRLRLTPLETEIVHLKADLIRANGFEVERVSSGNHSQDDIDGAEMGKDDEEADDGESGHWQLVGLPVSKDISFTADDLYELIGLLVADSSLNPSAGSRSRKTVSLSALSERIPRPSKVHRMLASRACRSSVMIGRSLTMAQMERLVRRMSGLEKPWTCPHGRPTMRHLGVLATKPICDAGFG